VKILDTIIDMTNNNLATNNYTPISIYFGPSYNKRENYHETTSQVFLDDRFRSENSTVPILARILVVDDEPDINLVIKKMLERQRGFLVDSFDDPNSVLRSFSPGSYDLLILEIRTRNMNGIDLYNRIRKKDDNIKVCFMSASNYYEEIRNRLAPSDEVNSSFLQKPFQSEELLRCVDKLIKSLFSIIFSLALSNPNSKSIPCSSL
jgi:CheY-like chemotaxis protein